MSAITPEVDAEIESAWAECFIKSNGNLAWAYGPEAAKGVVKWLLENDILKVNFDRKPPKAAPATKPSTKNCKMLVIPRQPKWSNQIVVNGIDRRRHIGSAKTASEFLEEASSKWLPKSSAFIVIPPFWKSDDITIGFKKLQELQIKVVGLIPKERSDADALKNSLTGEGITSFICSNEEEAISMIQAEKLSKAKENAKPASTSSTESINSTQSDHPSATESPTNENDPSPNPTLIPENHPTKTNESRRNKKSP